MGYWGLSSKRGRIAVMAKVHLLAGFDQDGHDTLSVLPGIDDMPYL